MAIKPSATFTHATNLNFSLGPAVGFPTKLPVPDIPNGYVPGTGVSAEQVNQQFNILGDYTVWLAAGSNLPGLDAHLIETDALGVSRVASTILGGTAGGDGALVVSANAGATAFAGSFTNIAGGFAITATASGALAAVRGTNTGTGAGVEGVHVSVAGPGVSGTGNLTGPGVIGTGGTDGNGVEGDATGNGHGVEGTCQIGSFAGCHGVGSAANPGTFGVLGETTQGDGVGVAGFNLQAGADPSNFTHSAVLGASVDGTGLWGTSTNGHGVWVTGNVTRSGLHLDPQVDPGTPVDGDLYPDSTTGLLSYRRDASTRRVHESLGGFVHESTTGLASARNGAAFVVEPGHFVTLGVLNGPKIAGDVELTFTASFRNVGAALNSIEIQFQDQTSGGVVILTTEIFMALTNAAVTTGGRPNAYEKTITFRARYTLPSAGARVFDLAMATHTGGPSGVEWSAGVLTVEGVY